MRQPNDTVADREFLQVDTDLALPAGAWKGVTTVNKFGYAPDGIQTLHTNIWDRSDAVPTQRVWTKPTQTRVHAIVSTSIVDGPGQAGARSIRVYGLTDWDSKEVSEDVTLNGTTSVDTVNSYVIIHRMHLVTWGSVGTNVGYISATAAVDGTVTAQINNAYGQTEMAIYGIPSVQTAYLTQWYAAIMKASGGDADARFQLVYNSDPSAAATITGTVKEVRGLQSNGQSEATWEKSPYKKFIGPGILAIVGFGSANDIDGAAGFDLILVDN